MQIEAFYSKCTKHIDRNSKVAKLEEDSVILWHPGRPVTLLIILTCCKYDGQSGERVRNGKKEEKEKKGIARKEEEIKK